MAPHSQEEWLSLVKEVNEKVKSIRYLTNDEKVSSFQLNKVLTT